MTVISRDMLPVVFSILLPFPPVGIWLQYTAAVVELCFSQKMTAADRILLVVAFSKAVAG